MSPYLFSPAPQASVAIRGAAARYAVNRIFCVGRNYAAHAREMGGDPTREAPFFFNKSPRHLLECAPDGSTVMPYAPGTRNLHHEMELVVALGAPVFRATPAQASMAVWGCACGLDMTRRDLQNAAKDTGRPWSFGKDFEHAAVIGELVPVGAAGPLDRGRIQLTVNGAVKQSGDLADMIWRVPEVVANLSQFYHLAPGDLIYTGTPEGVGPVQPGDRLTGDIEGVGRMTLTVGAAAL